MNIPKNRKDWRNLIGNNIVFFSFLKKGDEKIRRMIGCHNLNIIPKENIPKQKNNKKRNPNIINIFDLEIKEWRSFDINTLIDISRIIPLELFNSLGEEAILEKFTLENDIIRLVHLRKVLNKELRIKRKKLSDNGQIK